MLVVDAVLAMKTSRDQAPQVDDVIFLTSRLIEDELTFKEAVMVEDTYNFSEYLAVELTSQDDEEFAIRVNMTQMKKHGVDRAQLVDAIKATGRVTLQFLEVGGSLVRQIQVPVTLYQNDRDVIKAEAAMLSGSAVHP